MITRKAFLFVYAGLFCAMPGAAAEASSVSIAPESVRSGAAPPVPAASLDILDTDYPLESLLANEEGRTGLNLLIDNTGRVTLAQIASTSGSRRLDRQAIQVATMRWAFEPLTGDRVPVAREMRVEVAWELPLRPADEFARDRSDTPGRKAWFDEIPSRVILFDEAPERRLPKLSQSGMEPFCRSRPDLEAAIPMASNGLDDRIQVSQWFHISTEGAVDDVLVQTEKGWMHLSAPLVRAANLSAGMRAAVMYANGQSCWFRTEFWLNSR